jgi:Ankyrin repeats (3 copies)
VLQALLARGASAEPFAPRCWPSALWLAVLAGCSGAVQLLIQHGANPIVQNPSDGSTPLMATAVLGDARMCAVIIDAAPVVQDVRCQRGRSALDWAIRHERWSVVRVLLRRDAAMLCSPDSATQTTSSWPERNSAGAARTLQAKSVATSRVLEWENTGLGALVLRMRGPTLRQSASRRRSSGLREAQDLRVSIAERSTCLEPISAQVLDMDSKTDGDSDNEQCTAVCTPAIGQPVAAQSSAAGAAVLTASLQSQQGRSKGCLRARSRAVRAILCLCASPVANDCEPGFKLSQKGACR